MDFELSEEQEQLRDSVRSVLERECPPTLVRSAYEGRLEGGGNRLWQVISDLDWPAIEVPESIGGLGMGFVELALIAEEMGRVVAPAPFMSTVAQFVPMVLETASPEQHKSLLGAVLNEGSTGTVAVAEPESGWDISRITTEAVRGGDGWALNGRKSFVFDGAEATTVLVVARGTGDSGLGVFAVPSETLTVDERKLIDPSQPLADIQLDGVRVPPDAVLVEPGDQNGADGIRRALEQATAALAMSMTGTCRIIFETTLQYTKDREQFGRPIGSFQAIKHRLVNMLIALERASSLAYFAALTIAEDDPRRSTAVSMAKAAAGDCQRLIVQDGLQLHGGIGYMWEQDLHFYLKRAKSGDLLFGSAAAHKANVARTLGLVA
jgi:alkylation response protein AidB-like acyl-CoA dehydrogenase